MLAWPSISCTWRRSAPPASRCVAKLCRSECGLSSGRAAGQFRVELDQLPNPLAPQPAAARRQQQQLETASRRVGQLRPLVLAGTSRPPRPPAAQRHDPLLVALAVAQAVALGQVHVARPHDRQLRHAAARGVEQFEHRPVAPPPRPRRLAAPRAGCRSPDVDSTVGTRCQSFCVPSSSAWFSVSTPSSCR